MSSGTKKKITVKSASSHFSLIPPNVNEISEDICRMGIGLDVHKDTVAVCVSGQTSTGEIIELKYHVFRNDHLGLQEMCRFLRRYNRNSTFLMECTGVYHVAVFRALNVAFPACRDRIIAMNPLLVHNRIADLGSKNDRADARSISALTFYTKILRPSYVGSSHFFAIRDHMRAYHRNHTQMTRLKNRIHRQLHLANQKFCFDMSKEWCLQLLDRYIGQSWSLKECFEDYSVTLQEQGKGKVLAKHTAEIMLHGDVLLTKEQRFTLQIDLLQLFHSERVGAIYLKRAEENILRDKRLSQHYRLFQLIPGFGPVTILTLLTEIGDYSRFYSSKAFVKFCGVIPTVQQSGKMRTKGHVNRFTNKHIRLALCQAAGVLIAMKRRNTDLGEFAYRQRHIRGLPFKKAVLKVAEKYSRTVYQLLTDRREYDPTWDITQKKRAATAKKLQTKGSLLESSQTRGLRRNIQDFFVSHSELLNATSRYHLVNGFERLIRKSQYLDREDQSEEKEDEMDKK
ncbi:MAG: IS110 family transposase [Promethearchaeota archaeon]